MRSAGVGASALLVEAYRNLRGAPARSLLVILLVAGGFLATVTESYSSARTATAEQAQLDGSGYDVVMLTGSGIRGSSCDALARISGVDAAGAEAPAGTVIVRPGDLSTYTAFDVTPGFLRVLSGPSPAVGQGVFLGPQAAAQLGVRRSSVRTLLPVAATGEVSGPGTQARLVAVDFEPRGQYYARSIFVTVPSTEAFSACAVALRSPAASLAPEILAARLSATGAVQAQWLVSHELLGQSPVVAFDTRPARWLWLALAIVTSLAAILINRARAVEFAVYRTHGASLPTVSATILTEYSAVALMVFATWPVAVALGQLHASTPLDGAAIQIAVLTGLRYLCAAVACIAAGTLLSVLGSPWELLRRP